MPDRLNGENHLNEDRDSQIAGRQLMMKPLPVQIFSY